MFGSERPGNHHDHPSNGQTEPREYKAQGDRESQDTEVNVVRTDADGSENTQEVVADDEASIKTRTSDLESAIATADIGDERYRGPPEQEGNGVLSAVSLMFGTPQNASFFTAVALSGMGKGIINTFLFIWSVRQGTGVDDFHSCIRTGRSAARDFQ